MLQNTTLADFLDNDYKDIWLLIKENKIASLLEQLKPEENKPSLLKRLFKKEQKVETDVLHLIVYELFKYGKSNRLVSQEFEIMNAKSDTLFKNLTRLLFAIELNGNYPELEEIVSHKLYHATQTIAEEIRTKANGYPANPINGQVWMGGAGMRSAFACFSYYYEKNDLPEAQLWVTKMRTIITLNIMGHYKTSVGPDMIELAELEEKLGLVDEALGRYKAVILDFDEELDYFKDDLEEQPDYDDHIILSSLLKSYQSVDRIEQTTTYTAPIQLIEEILKREIKQDEIEE